MSDITVHFNMFKHTWISPVQDKNVNDSINQRREKINYVDRKMAKKNLMINSCDGLTKLDYCFKGEVINGY